MASEKPEYFLPRNWDYPPNGPIKIGNVFMDVKEPHKPVALVKPDDDMLIQATKTSAEIESGQVKSGGVTVTTTFLGSLLGVGVDFGVDHKKTSNKAFTIEGLDTEYVNTGIDEDSGLADLTPYQEYLKRCVEHPRVKDRLEMQWLNKRVYIITGVKTVRGAKVTTSTSRATEGSMGTQIDGTPLGMPIGGGPEFRRGREKSLKMSWSGSPDFVLAYKFSEVQVNRAGEVTKEKEHLKGAFMELTQEKTDGQLVATIMKQPDIKNETTMSVAEGEDVVKFGIFEDNDSGEDDDSDEDEDND